MKSLVAVSLAVSATALGLGVALAMPPSVGYWRALGVVTLLFVSAVCAFLGGFLLGVSFEEQA